MGEESRSRKDHGPADHLKQGATILTRHFRRDRIVVAGIQVEIAELVRRVEFALFDGPEDRPRLTIDAGHDESRLKIHVITGTVENLHGSSAGHLNFELPNAVRIESAKVSAKLALDYPKTAVTMMKNVRDGAGCPDLPLHDILPLDLGRTQRGQDCQGKREREAHRY